MGIAIADIMVMMEYVPYALITFIIDLQTPPQRDIKYTHSWRPIYLISHCHFYYVIRGISSWLHVNLALWRYMIIRLYAAV